MSVLFSPYALRGLHLSNRIVVSPMCQYSAVNGEAQAWHMMHLGGLALSGAGMLILEATAVEPDGRISPFDLGLWNDATEAALKPIFATIRRHAKIGIAIQLAHAGRKASSAPPWKGGQTIPSDQGGWTPWAPSALAFKPQDPSPLPLDDAGLDRIRRAFADAARRSADLGIDAIEIHAAHGVNGGEKMHRSGGVKVHRWR